MSSAADLLAAGSLPRAWARRWREAPDALVMHAAATGWVTATELERWSRSWAQRLADMGLGPGDRVLLSASPSAELVAFYVGALRLGLVVVPANTAYGPSELDHIVEDAAPAASAVDDGRRVSWFGGLPVLRLGDGRPPPQVPSGPAGLDTTGPGDAALICYTSGTTGRPKGAVLSHANLLAGAEAVRLAWRWDATDRLVLALPLFHMHGLGVGVNGTLVAGGSMVVLDRFDVDLMLDASRDHEATLFFGVPTMYARLAASERVGELARLRLCVSGSAPLPPAVFDRIAAAGGQRIMERYGMTETVMILSNPYDGERRPGRVGFPLPGVEVGLAAGQPSEILVRGPNVFGGYWRDPDATAAAFTSDGWFRTGDIGQFDADGSLAIVGRSKELIISGGFNVYPREVEDALLSHPGVAEAAVAGTPDDEWGEIVTAYLVPAGPDLDLEQLAAHASARLAPYKRPRRWHVVGNLPRNALGKIKRDELRAPGSPP